MKKSNKINKKQVRGIRYNKTKSCLKEIDGTKYLLIDDKVFDKQGNIKSLRDIFREINGKTYIFEDGTFLK